MDENKVKIYIGFIIYGKTTAKYLPYFLPSLKAQAYRNFKILAVDNSEAGDSENAVYLKNNFPEIELTRAEKNLGFAKAFNLMIRQATKDGADYFLALNPDMILEPDAVGELIEAVKKDEKIAAVQPKILKWDFENNKKTKIVDSYGVVCDKKFRFRDEGQGREDDKIGSSAEEIFGFTGAAVLLNLKALKDVAFYNGESEEYFDELMFMYKEDCDLSMRLRLAGWKIILAPSAVAYHDRAVASVGETNFKIALNRFSKNRQVKKWAYLNHWIMLLKLKSLSFPVRVKLATAWYQFESLVFILLFEQYLLKELVTLWKLRKKINNRKNQLKVVIRAEDIKNLFIYEKRYI